MGNHDTLLDRLAIRELVENWMIFRDNREWDRFLDVWHDDGVVMTTWGGQATPQQFVEGANKGFAAGNQVLHSGGAVTALVNGDRGFAMSKLRIMQRGLVEGVECDVTCIGVIFDFAERRAGRWGLVLRQPVYERDYIAPTDPNQTVHLDPEIMARRPDGYQRLAYLQESLGNKIVPDMPTETGTRREALVQAREAWLRGEPLAWPS
ncbi:nuclear transport factor 2 family protein [Streptomyces sp. B21-083]|uniref:nuclear transport factor 2 family protein n=1 Tax=Streptomyces sp. B21-083 TaxID=3039410 RepID=UPI002FEEE10E